MTIDCRIMARAAAKEALARPTKKFKDSEGVEFDAYWARMTLGHRYIDCYVDARLVDIAFDREQEFLENEFLAFAEGLVQEAGG